jgi:hypothetical protein
MRSTITQCACALSAGRLTFDLAMGLLADFAQVGKDCLGGYFLVELVERLQQHPAERSNDN